MSISKERWFSAEDIKNIPKEDTPLMVLSDAVQSAVAARIKALQNGTYNHFMILLNRNDENVFVSQDATFRVVSLSEYVDNKHRLKFWYNPYWTNEEKTVMFELLIEHLEKPWYKRLYDIPQIFGLRFGLRWLQIPGARICSDFFNIVVGRVDTELDVSHLSPPEVNRWLIAHPKYKVYGRYTPD